VLPSPGRGKSIGVTVCSVLPSPLTLCSRERGSRRGDKVLIYTTSPAAVPERRVVRREPQNERRATIHTVHSPPSASSGQQQAGQASCGSSLVALSLITQQSFKQRPRHPWTREPAVSQPSRARPGWLDPNQRPPPSTKHEAQGANPKYRQPLDPEETRTETEGNPREREKKKQLAAAAASCSFVPTPLISARAPWEPEPPIIGNHTYNSHGRPSPGDRRSTPSPTHFCVTQPNVKP